jgi:predicted SAM-dependent methyltransferase
MLSEVLLVIAGHCRRFERRLYFLLSRRHGTPKGVRLHLGCGEKRIDGFINIDGTMTGMADRVMNVLDLDFPANTVDEIYSSHMIEHLTPEQFDVALDNWYTILRPGGLLTLRCPNFNFVLDHFFLDKPEPDRWEHIPNIFGPTSHGPSPYNQHRNAFSVRRLQDILKAHGFEVIKCHACPNRENTLDGADVFCVARKPEQK